MNTTETQTTATQLEIANTIAQQIGGVAFYMMGTRHKLGTADSLIFDIRGSQQFNKITVTLDLALDTYIVTFRKVNRMGHILAERKVEDVYAEDLKRIISDYTGLALSL